VAEAKLSGAGPIKSANHCNLKVSLANGAGRELAMLCLEQIIKPQPPGRTETLHALVVERNPRVALAPRFEEEGCLKRHEQMTLNADHISIVPGRIA